MNKPALFTAGRKLQGGGVHLLSVFDLEPSGIIVHAYNQISSSEHSLPISEADLAKAGYTRSKESLAALLETIVLVPLPGGGLDLQSTNEDVGRNKLRPTGEEVENMIKSPIKKEAVESIHSLLVSGLVELCKVKPVGTCDAVEFLGEWLLQNNPNKPVVRADYEVEEADMT